MVSKLLAVVRIPNDDNTSRDIVQNSWCFSATDATPTTCAHIVSKITPVYSGIGAWLSAEYSWVAVPVEFYDLTGHLDGTPHGSPINIQTMAVSGIVAHKGMPPGVAICGSYHSTFGTTLESGPADSAIPTGDRAVDEGAPATHAGVDRMRSRLRGRIYFGPLNVDAVAAPGTGASVVPDTTLMSNLVSGLTTLALTADAVSQWHQWSRRSAATAPITGGFVSAAFTYQRDREVKSLARTAWGSPA